MKDTLSIEEVEAGYKGLSREESIAYQLKYWVEGIPTFNPITEVDTPDFSSSYLELLAEHEVRKRFATAHNGNNRTVCNELLAIWLSNLVEVTLPKGKAWEVIKKVSNVTW